MEYRAIVEAIMRGQEKNLNFSESVQTIWHNTHFLLELTKIIQQDIVNLNTSKYN